VGKKSKYRVTNWREYNAALKQRGSLTFWISGDLADHWYAKKEGEKTGCPFTYSNICIETMLSLRHIFKLPLRQVVGFTESIFKLMGQVLSIPEFSRLSKRAHNICPRFDFTNSEEETYLVLDSTGLKVFGEKEWLETKHGKQYQRKVWRKLHISVDSEGYITSSVLTDHKTDDRSCVSFLLDSSGRSRLTEILADSGYDSHQLYKNIENRKGYPLIPPCSTAVVFSPDAPTLRDKAVAYIQKKGYEAWYNKNNFGRRERVENTFYRIKTIFGRKLLSRKTPNQQAEEKIICSLLNKMTQLGMPKSVKIT
jgi:transposase